MDYTASENLNIAVVGSGISGICAAYLLQKKHRVTLFEKNDYIGGHTNTVLIPEGPDKGSPVDTGFIVLNQRTYPNLLRFLGQLNVQKQRTDMSFSYHCETTGLCYASRNLNALFAQRLNVLSPRYLRFTYEMFRFLRLLRDEYLSGELADMTLADYLNNKGFHTEVKDWFIIPMAAAIWSGSDLQMEQFPIQTFARFYENHGLLAVTGHPPWYFIKNGSHTYVKAFLETFSGQVVKSSPIASISREKDRKENGVTLHFEDREPAVFDAVVLAAHADQSLALLQSPSGLEEKLLSAWQYSSNQTYLHTDRSVMPPNPRAWASWNYIRHRRDTVESPVTVSYDMNRLQKLRTAKRYFVTLNPGKPIPETHVIKTFNYTHPQYSFDALNTQKDLPALNGHQHTFFCGSYFGYGFHEDGVASALQVGKQFGVSL